MIPKNIIDDILKQADIVDVVSNYINVIKKGNSYVAICPFHNDTNPSMHLNQKLQIYKCFSCNAGGNVFTFVQNYEKVSFIDAVRKVAKIINYNHPDLYKEERKVDNKTQKLIKSLKDANEFYNYILLTNAGVDGKKYFTERNISDEMIKYFSLGFSPNNGAMSIKQLRSKGHDVETLEEVGILIREQSEMIDRFHGRVMFPLYNQHSEVIGFSGRIIADNGDAKYVNSPSSPLFNKSCVLYNIQNAFIEAKRSGYCYIVEGFMDVISLYRCDIKSSVAIMGTAFTEQHAEILKKLNVELRLCLDADNAGQTGIIKMIPILDKYGIKYRIVDYLNDLRDPDEIFNQEGKDYLIIVLNRLITKYDFLIKFYSKRFDLTAIEGKRDFIKTIFKYVKVSDYIELEAVVSKMSEISKISSSAIKNELKRLKLNKEKDEINVNFVQQTKKMNKTTRIQRLLISFMLKDISSIEYIEKSSTNIFIDNIYSVIANYIYDIYSYKKDFNINDLLLNIQMNGDDSSLVNEITEISADTNYPEYDKEIVDENIKILNDEYKKMEFSKTFEDLNLDDDLTKAALLDNRYKE